MKYPSIILVETSHPGNIGAAARAIKNMGLKQLVLVRPKTHHLDPVAIARASGAVDILEQAKLYENLEDAISAFTHVVAMSHRKRTVPIQMHTTSTFFNTFEVDHSYAFVFGNEQYGLTNEDLDLCQYQLTIDANPDYPSLNVASSVQIITYECHKQFIQNKYNEDQTTTEPMPTQEEVTHFRNHLHATIEQLGVLRPKQATHTLRRITRLFNRANPSQKDIALWRGILTAIDKHNH